MSGTSGLDLDDGSDLTFVPQPEQEIWLSAEDLACLAKGGGIQVGEVVIHGPPEHECMCGTIGNVHERGVLGCEMHEHHCDTCHERHSCTLAVCGFNPKER